MRRATRNRIITIFILMMFLGSSVTYALISAIPTGTAPTGWRALLVIQVNEEQELIPAGVGISGNETTGKLYTISNDGILYKSVSGDVTLKDFFDEWNKTFNIDCVLTYCNTNTSSVAMFVGTNSNDLQKNYDYQNYVIQNGNVILIDYR